MLLKQLIFEIARQFPIRNLSFLRLNEDDFVSLQKKSFVNRKDRTDLFVDKLIKGEPIDLTNSQKAVIDKVKINNKEYTGDNFKDLKDVLPTLQRGDTLKFFSDGKSYNISAFAKTTELGGKGKGGTLGPERKVLGKLKQQFEEIGGTITLKIGANTYEGITGVENVKENQKADFMFTGTVPVYVSYKPGNSPKSMISYGGITKIAGKSPTVSNFIEAVKEKTKKETGDGESISTFDDHKKEYSAPLDPATDQDLILRAMYGSQVGEGGGENNVQVILQGDDIQLEKENDGVYKLSYSHAMFRPEIPKGEYAPVLNARYADDRNQFGIQHCRVGVIPAGARPNAKSPFD